MKKILLKDDQFITFKPFSYQSALKWVPLQAEFLIPSKLVEAETYAKVQLALVENEIEKHLLITKQIALVADG